MEMTNNEKFNEELREFCREFKESRYSEKRIYYIFKKLLPYFSLWKIHDPTKVLEKGDFESYAFEGFIKALNLYVEEKNTYPLNWFIYISKQTVLKKLREDTHYNKYLLLNSTNTENIEELLDSREVDDFINDIDSSMNKITDYKSEVYNLLAKMEEDQDEKLSLAVQWKLAFPKGNNTGLYPFLGYKRRNPISKLKRRVKAYSVKWAEDLFD